MQTQSCTGKPPTTICASHGPGGGGGDNDNFDDSGARSGHDGMIAGTEQSQNAQDELNGLVTQLELSGVDVLTVGADTLLSQEVAAIERCLEGGCFVAGTPVQMADGSTKPIEQVRKGDLVLSRDQSAGSDGKVVASRVSRTFVHQHANDQMVTVTLSSGERITCTDNHPFFVPGKGWTAAGKLCLGTTLSPRAGPTEPAAVDAGVGAGTVRVTGVERHDAKTRKAGSAATGANSATTTGTTTVYNFEVEGTHTYFVGNSGGGEWVHNDCN